MSGTYGLNPQVMTMYLEKLIKAFRRISDALHRFLRSSVTDVNNPISNDHDTFGPDVPPENELDPKAKIKPNEMPPAPELLPEKSRDAKSQGCYRGAPPEKTPQPAAFTKNDKPTKTPQERGGRRGKRSKQNSVVKEKTPPEAKPELICREEHHSNQWNLLLVLPHDKNIAVSQNDLTITPTPNNSKEYLLSNFTEDVNVNWTENDKPETIKLFDVTSPLIFKLRKNWKGDGRQVKHMSDGYYVVLAPRDWRRKGNPPVDNLESSDNEFLAHHFFSDDSDEPDGFAECNSLSANKRFSLVGESIADDSNMGDLFVGDALQLRDTENWQGVSWIRVGEERDGNWSENFKPTEEELAAILKQREGWFYVRVYDDDVQLIHSIDFRRSVKLKKILVNGEPHSSENIFVPDSRGHAEKTVQFIGDDISIKIQENNGGGHPTSSCETNTTRITPHPDKTYWTLNGKVDIVIRLSHVWWCMKSTNNEPSQWRDTPFEIPRDEFRSNRNAFIIVRLPEVARKILVGFDSFNRRTGARGYPAKSNHDDDTKQAEFQLRDFCGHNEVSERSPAEIFLRVKCGQKEFSIVCIPADSLLPKSEPEPDLPKKPLPTVRIPSCTKRIRPVTRNKGFSRLELEAAELTRVEAKRLGIVFDRRRRSKHHANIDALRSQRGNDHAD